MADELSSTPAPKPPETVAKRGTKIDVLIAFGAWGAILLCLLIVTLNFDTGSAADRLMLLLAGTGGGTLGWATGIILTPYDAGEGRTFSGLSKAVYGLITGYVVAKIDPLVTTLVHDVATTGVPMLAAAGASFALITFVGAATVTFISRKYWL